MKDLPLTTAEDIDWNINEKNELGPGCATDEKVIGSLKCLNISKDKTSVDVVFTHNH